MSHGPSPSGASGSDNPSTFRPNTMFIEELLRRSFDVTSLQSLPDELTRALRSVVEKHTAVTALTTEILTELVRTLVRDSLGPDLPSEAILERIVGKVAQVFDRDPFYRNYVEVFWQRLRSTVLAPQA